MNKSAQLQKWGGTSAILEGIIYISAFIIYGAVLQFPESGTSAVQEITFLTENRVILSVMNLWIYVLFGVLLAVLVLTMYHQLKPNAPTLASIASIFGVVWVGLVIASGMIANIGLNAVIKLGATEPEQALSMWSNTSIVVEGLGGGNEVVGGLWVLLLSLAALKGGELSKPLIFIGLFVGAIGIATIYPLEVFTELFGISQIIWFIWLGIFLLWDSTKT